MTVSSTVIRLTWLGDGTSTSFPITFSFYLASDIEVVLGGTILSSGYSITGGGTGSPPVPGRGTLVMASPPASGVQLQAILNVPLTQLVNLVDGTAFQSAVLNQVNDRAIMGELRLNDLVSRAIRAPDGDYPGPGMVLPAAAQRAGMFVSFDGSGNVLLASSGPGTANTPATLGPMIWPLSRGESAAGVNPTNFIYAWGDLRRYGADPTGVAPADAAITTACSCNSEVFDGEPGGGTYLLATGVTISQYPLRIRGRRAWATANSSTAVTGTQFIIGTGAACGFQTTAPVYGLTIEACAFTWQTFTTGQIALKFGNDLRYSKIEGCTFIGSSGVSGVSVIGIECVNSSIFTGDLVIANNFFDVLYAGIVLQSACTTVKIIGNEFYGHAGVGAISSLGVLVGGSGYTNGTWNNVPLTGGSGSGALAQVTVAGGAVTAVTILTGGTGYVGSDIVSASPANLGPGSGFTQQISTVADLYGVGVQVTYPAAEPVIMGNYFEGFGTGIYANGGGYLKQIGNDYGPNINHFVWANTHLYSGIPRIWNQSFGESFVGTGNLIYPQDNQGLVQVLSGPGTYYLDNTVMNTGLGFQEQQRTYKLGFPQNVPFAAGNYSGSAAMTWGSVTQTTLAYEIEGKTLTVWFNASGTAGGTPSPALQIAIPQGFSAAYTVQNACLITNGGTAAFGFAQATASASVIQIFKDATGGNSWTAGTVQVQGTIRIPVN